MHFYSIVLCFLLATVYAAPPAFSASHAQADAVSPLGEYELLSQLQKLQNQGPEVLKNWIQNHPQESQQALQNSFIDVHASAWLELPPFHAASPQLYPILAQALHPELQTQQCDWKAFFYYSWGFHPVYCTTLPAAYQLNILGRQAWSHLQTLSHLNRGKYEWIHTPLTPETSSQVSVSGLDLEFSDLKELGERGQIQLLYYYGNETSYSHALRIQFLNQALKLTELWHAPLMQAKIELALAEIKAQQYHKAEALEHLERAQHYSSSDQNLLQKVRLYQSMLAPEIYDFEAWASQIKDYPPHSAHLLLADLYFIQGQQTQAFALYQHIFNKASFELRRHAAYRWSYEFPTASLEPLRRLLQAKNPEPLQVLGLLAYEKLDLEAELLPLLNDARFTPHVRGDMALKIYSAFFKQAQAFTHLIPSLIAEDPYLRTTAYSLFAFYLNETQNSAFDLKAYMKAGLESTEPDLQAAGLFVTPLEQLSMERIRELLNASHLQLRLRVVQLIGYSKNPKYLPLLQALRAQDFSPKQQREIQLIPKA